MENDDALSRTVCNRSENSITVPMCLCGFRQEDCSQISQVNIALLHYMLHHAFITLDLKVFALRQCDKIQATKQSLIRPRCLHVHPENKYCLTVFIPRRLDHSQYYDLFNKKLELC